MSTELEEAFHEKGVLETRFQAADNKLFTANLNDPFDFAKIDELAKERRELFNAIQEIDHKIAKLIKELYDAKKIDG